MSSIKVDALRWKRHVKELELEDVRYGFKVEKLRSRSDYLSCLRLTLSANDQVSPYRNSATEIRTLIPRK